MPNDDETQQFNYLDFGWYLSVVILNFKFIILQKVKCFVSNVWSSFSFVSTGLQTNLDYLFVQY